MSKGDTVRPRTVSQAEWERNFDRAFAPTRAPTTPAHPHVCPDCGGEAYAIRGERDVCLDCGRGAPV
jgi:hypothetical protein